MYSNIPLQNLYFNQIAGKDIAGRWELDYFSLSNRQALEWIVENDSSKKISIQTNDNSPLYDNAVFLSDKDLKRVNFLKFSDGLDSADYVIVRQDKNLPSKRIRNFLNSPGENFDLVYQKLMGETEIFSIFASSNTKI
jgi:hypothetical protein